MFRYDFKIDFLTITTARRINCVKQVIQALKMFNDRYTEQQSLKIKRNSVCIFIHFLPLLLSFFLLCSSPIHFTLLSPLFPPPPFRKAVSKHRTKCAIIEEAIKDVNMENMWNDTERGRPECSEKTLS